MSIFEGNYNSIGVELTESDLVPDKILNEHIKEQDEPEKLLEFIRSEQGGGGMPKCYPMSYLQGNFAYHHLKSTGQLSEDNNE